MAGNAIEAGGQNQPQIQVSMSHTPSRNISPKRQEESNAQTQSAQSSPKQDVAAQPQPQQIGQNYSHQPVQNNLQSINGAIQTNGQQQPLQQIQMPMQRVPSLGIISPAVHASVGDTPQISPKDNNLQFAQPVQQNLNLNPGQQQVQMHVLQQVPQQTLFEQQHQQHQHQQQQHQSQQQQQIGQQQQHIINQQFLGQQTFSLQQQPIMFQPQMIPQQQFQQQQHQQSQQQQSMQQQMYHPQLQQHVAMVQAPVLYAAQPAAVVSNPAAAAGGPASANNTPVSKAVKKGRFRVVKPGKQDGNEIGDGQSVVSSTSENPSEIVAPAVTTKKKGRFLIKTKATADTGKLSPTKESVSDANKSDADDAVSKGGGLPPQLPTSSDKAAGANNVKKKGRFRVKSGLNLADAEASLASDKPDTHVRRPSEDTLQSIPRISSEVTADENAPSIASNTQVPATTANTQVPQGMDGVGRNNNAFPQYTTFVPSMTSYDVNNQVMMVSAPFLTAQNTSMPMMQTSVQQSQMQQMYQNQVQAQQQHQQQQPQQHVPQTQQPEQNAAPSSHPMGLPLSNPNSPNPRTEPTQTQPQVPLLPQQSRSGSPIPKRPTASSAQTGTNSGSGGWRGISGSHGKNGRLIGCGGVGKILHNLDSLRQEILDADKSMTSLQSDNRFLRNKNKELESKISNLEKRLAEEKSLRRSTDVKLQSLRQKVKELEPPANNDAQAGEETIASDGKQVSKAVEEKSTGTQTAPVAKPQEPDDCDGGQESKSQTSPPKKSASLYKVEGEPKPNSPLSIRRALTGSESMSDMYIASLAKSQEAAAKQFDPLAALAPPLCPPTSSVAMAQNFQSLVGVDDNVAPIPMIVTTQKMPPSDVENTIEAKGNENGQHFDPLGTPEKSQSQLNIQTLVLNPMIPSVPTLTHLNGSPAMATVPVYTLPIPTIQLPPQHQQGQSKQAEHDPFDDIVCRGQNVEQNGNGYHDCMR